MVSVGWIGARDVGHHALGTQKWFITEFIDASVVWLICRTPAGKRKSKKSWIMDDGNRKLLLQVHICFYTPPVLVFSFIVVAFWRLPTTVWFDAHQIAPLDHLCLFKVEKVR